MGPCDAQELKVRAVFRFFGTHPTVILLSSHGGVGTLLLCELLDAPISRSRDQPFPGHFFTFEWPGYEVIHEWRPIAEG